MGYPMDTFLVVVVERLKYLLDINLDDLDDSSGEDQAIWLLALKAAREAHRLRDRNAAPASEAPD
eukprot:scaffold54757_cov60-Cyclotella_meneghiniana.AAC.2